MKQLLKNTTQKSAPGQDSYEWQGVWEDMGRHLEQWAPLVFWNFTPEQVLKPKKLVECLKQVCLHPCHSKETTTKKMWLGL